MKRAILHLALPVVLASSFLLIASSPVQVLGCRMRGMLALLLALLSGLTGLVSGVRLLKARGRRDPDARLWFASTLILTIPLIALFLML